MAKSKLQDLMKQAQAHIKAGRYDEARSILERIDAKVDNPTVKKWLARLDEIAPKDDPFRDLEFPDTSKKPQKKRGKLSLVGFAIGACALLTFCSVLGQGLGIFPDATERAMTSVAKAAATEAILSQTPPTATDTVAPTETAIPSDTATLSPVPSATPLPSDTPTITLSPTITQTPLPSNTPLPTLTPAPSNTAVSATSLDDAELIKTGLAIVTDIDVVSVQIADGRANGGDRSVIITYRSKASDSSGLAGEWGLIFGSVGGTVRGFDLDLDAMSIIVGDPYDNTVGIVAAEMSDVISFINQTISAEEFLSRLDIQTF